MGALLPKSKKSAAKVVANFKPGKHPKNYLETGVGTGTITDSLLKKMGKNDTVTLVEISPKLCDILRDKYKDNPNVTIFEGSILDFPFKEDAYDAIICSLPIILFKASELKKLLNHYQTSIKNGGILSYMESSSVRLPTLTFSLFPKMKIASDIIDRFISQNEKTGAYASFAGFTPIKIHYLKITK